MKKEKNSKFRVSGTVNYLPELFELLLGFTRADLENVDDLGEVVEVNNEGSAVSSGGERADYHEGPVEAVSAGEEAREGDRGGRRLHLLGLLDLLVRLDLLPGRLRALVHVRRRRFGRLRHLRHGRQWLYVRWGPPEQPPRDHHLRLGLPSSELGTRTHWVTMSSCPRWKPQIKTPSKFSRSAKFRGQITPTTNISIILCFWRPAFYIFSLSFFLLAFPKANTKQMWSSRVRAWPGQTRRGEWERGRLRKCLTHPGDTEEPLSARCFLLTVKCRRGFAKRIFGYFCNSNRRRKAQPLCVFRFSW